MPHRFIPHTPKLYIFKLEVLDSNKNTVFSTIVRFFDPDDKEGRTRGVVKSFNATGELIALPRFETLKRLYDLPASVGSSGSIRLTVLKKSEYKKNDDEADLVYRREEKFTLASVGHAEVVSSYESPESLVADFSRAMEGVASPEELRFNLAAYYSCRALREGAIDVCDALDSLIPIAHENAPSC